MKFAIYCSNVVPFHAFSLLERPLGGTETGVIRLAESLERKGHEVTVFTPLENPPESKPRYLHKSEIEKSGHFDIFIAVRDWIPLLFNVSCKKRFFWTGDSYDQFPNFGIGDKRISGAIDGLLAVSQWHGNTLSQASGFPTTKVFVLGNGIDLSLFEGSEEKNPYRLIYSSTPYRGLEHTPRLYRELKKEFPQLEFHVFSGYQVYDQKNPEFEKLREELKSLKDVFIHGNILQDQLAREFMKSGILFYPCHFEETSCITAMEAQAGGCIVVSTALAALPETVGDGGILIPKLPADPDFDSLYIKAIKDLLSSPQQMQKIAAQGRERAKKMSWDYVADRFLAHLKTNSL